MDKNIIGNAVKPTIEVRTFIALLQAGAGGIILSLNVVHESVALLHKRIGLCPIMVRIIDDETPIMFQWYEAIGVEGAVPIEVERQIGPKPIIIFVSCPYIGTGGIRGRDMLETSKTERLACLLLEIDTGCEFRVNGRAV